MVSLVEKTAMETQLGRALIKSVSNSAFHLNKNAH